MGSEFINESLEVSFLYRFFVIKHYFLKRIYIGYTLNGSDITSFCDFFFNPSLSSNVHITKKVAIISKCYYL